MSAAFLSISPVAWAAGADYGTLKFDENAFDFGDVYRGQQLAHSFRFVNTGSGPVTIQGVHAACGCTAVEIERGRKYQPGEGGVVEVKLDTTDFAGPLVKTVSVLSSERPLPDRTLTVRAAVRTEVEADPPLADLGDVYSQTGATRTVRIKPINGFKLSVGDLTYNKATLDASVKPDGDGWALEVTLKPGLPPGFVKETILVRTNAQHLKELPVPVRATVKGNIDYTPTYLEFGAIAPADFARRAITMRGVGSGAGFDVRGMRAELIVNGRRIDDATKYIKVDALPHEQGRQLVSVELRNGANAAGSVHGKLIFETSDPAQKELAVDFYAFFR